MRERIPRYEQRLERNPDTDQGFPAVRIRVRLQPYRIAIGTDPPSGAAAAGAKPAAAVLVTTLPIATRCGPYQGTASSRTASPSERIRLQALRTKLDRKDVL